MKKNILSFLAILCMVSYTHASNNPFKNNLNYVIVWSEATSMAAALTLPLTFENTGANYYEVVDFEGIANTSTIVTDPKDGINKVVKTIKTSGSGTSGGTTVANTSGFGKIPFEVGKTTMSIRVYSPTVGIPVRLKVEDKGDNTVSVETEATTKKSGEWEILVFDFSKQATGTEALKMEKTYNKASIFFNFGAAGAGKTYYWDDVSFGDTALTLAVDNFSDSLADLIVYPNPTSDQLQLAIPKGLSTTDYEVSITTLSGKTFDVPSERVDADIVLDVSNLEAGVYFVRLVTKSGSTDRQFIKQ